MGKLKKGLGEVQIKTTVILKSHDSQFLFIFYFFLPITLTDNIQVISPGHTQVFVKFAEAQPELHLLLSH